MMVPGDVWKIKLKALQTTIDRALHVSNKTPLVVDNTATTGAITFFEYQSVVTVDGKGMVMRKATKDATLEELQEECRQKVVLAMTNGYPLVFNLRNSAPDFKNTFFSSSNEKFPAAVMETKAVTGFTGKGTALLLYGAIAHTHAPTRPHIHMGIHVHMD